MRTTTRLETKAEMIDRIEHVKMESFEGSEKVETTLLRELRKWTFRNDSTLSVHDARSIG